MNHIVEQMLCVAVYEGVLIIVYRERMKNMMCRNGRLRTNMAIRKKHRFFSGLEYLSNIVIDVETKSISLIKRIKLV